MAQIYTDRQILVDVNELQYTDRYFSPESQYYRTQIQATREIERKYESEPSNFLCLAIFAAFCCCWPIGLFAIRAARQANAATDQGHFKEAREKNRTAVLLILASVVFGIIAATFIAVSYSQQ
ncbi:synapse differentiation-inducing gene protein 1-like [Mytilus californianus]|uniref:synapse differentiation-inducing gene protein 1-like n=1 Tax=Mytilus californianus TaxID=6549 RepID=UPI0022465E81|nr:synapse differentiation-inducing gene protein 1-like [Mytilus californianus]